MNNFKIKECLQQFFNEDFGDGDLTSETIFHPHDMTSGTYTVKSPGVISGIEILKEGYGLMGEGITFEAYVKDGDPVSAGEDIFFVKGPVQKLLSAERVLLNLLQRMSGIATITDGAVRRLNSNTTKICDTRKTTPGLRMFEKYAVTCGGGFNHRRGLYDSVMIKDNHIAHAGSITLAVDRARSQLGHTVKIEVETTGADEVIEAVQAGADIIMFDNCGPEDIKELIKLVPDSIITEASGGINLATIGDYGSTGVDYISLGCLTHSFTAMDISFNIGKVLTGPALH
ncbi:nicotinate-nucleotide pyrophosphorylase [carboxylating] [Scopulibacillus darangshiensis]|uniref:Probable nicotinate-nucleotide pyrophosphorylase [carboxylating] n=1 Tax=Scopulibacillus darangshiensis TaxID=442528 RepID=A0A4R2NDI6_9BACL|nr:carboxylating nicotinate-nucleotide diphosphorylase [Scopulibacillus darangshiensis]TCP19125.1 nicotinate-nucleotide pyrophosphorylase [carboxylating] [Scopulibacillus darangshiensis]